VPELLLGLAVIVGVVMIARGFLTAEPRVLAKILRWTAAAGLAGVAVLLIASGREGLLFSAAALVVPLALRLRGWRRRLGLGGGAAGPAPGRSSQVETRLLRMTLDHDSGALSGMVLAGGFAGQTLDQLTFGQLMTLLDESRREDPSSVPVLEAWLDRTQGADWRQRAAATAGGGSAREGGSAPTGGEPMTVEEAYAILGLKPGADRAAIREAHRTLMTKVHPDHGGSTWLAVKLNQARDRLLNP